MNSRLTGIFVLASILLLTSGCATPGVQTESLISAAEFEEMIRVEVREVEPIQAGEIVAATTPTSVR